MQNSLEDYEDGRSQPWRSKDLQYSSEMSLKKQTNKTKKQKNKKTLYQANPLGLLYFYWTFSIGGKYGLGTAQSSWSWTFESMSGSSTFHINLRRAFLVHMPALGYQMLRGKRKSDYLAQVKVAIFILEIKPCSLLPFLAQKRHFKRGNYRKQTKFT